MPRDMLHIGTAVNGICWSNHEDCQGFAFEFSAGRDLQPCLSHWRDNCAYRVQRAGYFFHLQGISNLSGPLKREYSTLTESDVVSHMVRPLQENSRCPSGLESPIGRVSSSSSLARCRTVHEMELDTDSGQKVQSANRADM